MEPQKPLLGRLLPGECQQLLFVLCGGWLLLMTGVCIALCHFGHEHRAEEASYRSSSIGSACTRLEF